MTENNDMSDIPVFPEGMDPNAGKEPAVAKEATGTTEPGAPKPPGPMEGRPRINEEILASLTEEDREKYSRIGEDFTDKTEDEVRTQAKNEGMSDEVIEMLIAQRLKEKLDKIPEMEAEVKDQEFEGDEETPDDKAATAEANKENGDLGTVKASLDKGNELMGRAARGEEVSQEELAEFIDDANERKGRIHEFLYNGDTGLLRPEKRFKRLAVKPTVSLLLAMLLMYMSALHMATNWATKRIGGGK